ncbi:bifunctional copper resistance protein CopD/cytochrome c oxidase assembly protein [Pseudoclavibacter chungangensis]|uniref:Bifunctional copper resistance protein CopD/cytochrome c oxidase assembly protein n=2 Tax=Pseudoclavibacter chungangensis TaxID=587635 RepID=A0A7J5C349_9MICO|nr:bifunctional copper resistance protein CopD/cytochrome c oxidase assembly protein [Pseudoclavibacter chungangensis]
MLLGLGFGGGAAAVALADPGPIVRWGLPVLRLAYNLTAAVTIGALVFASCVVSRTGPEFERVMRIASGAATAWTVATAGAAFFTYLQISGVPLSASAEFGEQLRFFFTEIDLGRLWLLDLGMILVLSVVVFAVRSMWGVGLSTLLALFALWPLASQGHAAGAANHETAIGGITLHYTGAAVWLGGLVLLALVTPALTPARRYDVVRRFSGIALVSFAVTAFSGVVAAVINVGSWAALTEPYGVLVVLKVVALIGLGIFGALQRRTLIGRMRPAEDGTAKRAPLAWLIGLELALMGVAAGLAAALGRTPSVVQDVTAEQLADPSPAQLLSGNELPPPFEFSRLFTEWRLDPIWTTLCVLGLALYLVGVVRLHRRGDRWPVLRTISFTLGILLLLYLVNGALIVYGQFLFSAHMSQHMVLSMITPIFLTLGAPMTLLLRAVPARHDGSTGAREWAMSIIHSRFSRFFTHPIVASVLFAGSLLIFYYTPLFRWAVTDHVGHMWMVADFLIVGYFFTQSLIGIDPIPNRAPYPLRLLALVLVMTFHAFFGLSIMTGTSLLMADWYGATGRTWGPATALDDQQLGGAISWGLGEFPTVILALLVAIAWYRSDEREQRRTDRRAARDGDAELKAYNEQLRALAERDRAADERRGGARGTTSTGDDA